ncbi:hypothetical protein VU05_01190 [Desulfobulbus sp. F1]|nr:hypothetical protein [Desulfobulbus sp. F1]
MTKIAEFPSFTPEQLSDMRDIFTRFEFILESLTDFQKSLLDMGADYACPVVSVLQVFKESWILNCDLFSRYFPDYEFAFDEISIYLASLADVFVASESAVEKELVLPNGSSSYSMILECVSLRCCNLLSSSRKKLKRYGIILEVKS